MKSGPVPSEPAVVGRPDEALLAYSTPPAPSAVSQRLTQITLNSSNPAIADHELLRVIGRGAYGEVWIGRHARLGTLRAVKIIRGDNFADLRPFQREFDGIRRYEPISRGHPNLVNILHVGGEDATFYYVMELADDAAKPKPEIPSTKEIRNPNAEATAPSDAIRTSGFGLLSDFGLRDSDLYTPHTLRSELKRHEALPIDRCLEIAHALGSALAHLHANGLVHRDVKPSNVIFVGGVAKLADIGLVAGVDDARSFVGTEGYIPPEGPGTPSADCYSLGKLLYELSTGHDRNAWPEPPADLAKRPDRERLLELNAILHRACAPHPRERYQSAEELLKDLDQLAEGKSIKQQHVWKRRLNHAKKFAVAVGALAVVAATVYWLSGRQMRPADSKQSISADFRWSTNEEAREEYMLGVRAAQAGNDPLLGIQHFQRAIDKDPNFAEAYARLAGALLASGGGAATLSKARVAAEKAISLDTNSAFAHSVLASVKVHDMDWAGADNERIRALTLKSNSQEILLESALNLAVMGRTNEALVDLEKARLADPDSASNLRPVFYGFVYDWSRQYDRAIKIYNQFPNGGAWVREQCADSYLAKGDYANAIRQGKQAALERGDNRNQVNAKYDALEKAFKEGGQRKYWELRLEFETSQSGEEHFMRMAAIHARLNQLDEAFEFLSRARQETPLYFAIGINTNPSFDSLREEKRFQKMIDELRRKK
jgi:tetratricopeptide (TPR) repeat protein